MNKKLKVQIKATDATGSVRVKLLHGMSEKLAAYVRRFMMEQRDPKQSIIIVAAVDDAYGSAFAEVFLPGFDWDTIRKRGETPVVVGVAPTLIIRELCNGMRVEHTLTPPDESTVLVAVVADGGILVAEVALAAYNGAAPN